MDRDWKYRDSFEHVRDKETSRILGHFIVTNTKVH